MSNLELARAHKEKMKNNLRPGNNWGDVIGLEEYHAAVIEYLVELRKSILGK